MRPIFHIRPLACAVLLTSLFAPAVRAQEGDITIPAGTDFLYTLAGTVYQSPNGPIPLFGTPTFPGGTDTMVMRLADADATTSAPIDTQITGLNLMGPPGSGVTVTLDPNHLGDDTGTMSFAITSISTDGVVMGTIADTLNVFYQANIAGAIVTGHELFTSAGTWTALLTSASNEVIDFKIIIDTHVDPQGNIHVVSSFVPEPSSWIMLAMAGLAVPAYAGWRRRRPRQTRVGQ
jgi:hypothetical protein